MSFNKFIFAATVMVAALALGACSDDDDNPVMIAVPDLSGLTQTAAESSITDAGLTVGTVTMSGSDTVAVGDLISQDPSAGTLVGANGMVDLNVSFGVAAAYTVSITNITHAQPMTPIAVVLHKHGYDAWNLGASASAGLEMLAESGSPASFLSEASANGNTVTTSASAGLTMPGIKTTLNMEVPIADVAGLHVSFASMFANTNDAFTGVTYLHIASLAVEESVSEMARVYDSGTEANTEAQADMPGPLGSTAGGFDAAREALNVVTVHAGVVTTADGLLTSGLSEVDRWLGPGAKVTVTRTK